MKLSETESNRKVIYKPFPNCPPELIEEGVITGSNDRYIFVRYGSDINSKATNPKDVDFI